MKFHLLNFVIAVILAGIPVGPATAADGSAVPPFRFYSTADGLTQSEVTDIDQDMAGYLWLTTRRGLNRYDGKDFEHFTIADGLPTNHLTTLHVNADNTVWVGDAQGGIAVIRDDRIVNTIEPIANVSTPIMDIAMSGDRILVLAKDAGILEVQTDGNGLQLERLGGESIGAETLSVHGSDIWIAAKTGLYRLAPGSEFNIQRISDEIRLVDVTADGTVWVVTANNKVGIWRDGTLDVRASLDTAVQPVSLVVGFDATVWVAARNELFKFDGELPGTVPAGNSFTRYEVGNGITSSFIDRENTLWLSSESRLIRFLGERFQHFDLKTDSDTETVWSIGEDSRGRLWFGTQSKLVMREPDESLRVIGPEHGLPRGEFRDTVFDENGDLWTGVRGVGLYRVDTTTMMGELIDGTEGFEILDIAIANDGAVWFSTYASGVFRYSPEINSLREFVPPRQTSVYTLDVSEDNSIWYAADDIGIVRLVPANDDSFAQEVYEAGDELRSKLFNHLRITDDNELWVATEEGGLYHFKSGTFTDMSTDAPWWDQTVYLVEVLDNGSVVVGGEQGLYQFRPGANHVAHYSLLSGFLGVETNVHATFIDSQRNLWIGTVNGATRMDTSLPIPEFREPAPQIVRMETVLDRIPVSNNANIDPVQQGIQVEFAAVSLMDTRGIQYSYRLVGATDDWSPATTNNSVSFSRLPPGSFEFVVRARYAGGEWSREMATRAFTIKPFFWQRTDFRLFIVVLLVLCLAAITKYRTRIVARQNERLRALVTERTESIQKAKQKLQISNEKLSREIRQRQETEKAREEMETRFRRAFENAPIGMALLDADGYLFDVNPALGSMLWPDTEPPFKSRFSDFLHEEDRARFVALLEKLKDGELDNCEDKIRSHAEDGSGLRFLINLSAVRSGSGRKLYTVLQVQDVTESRKMTEQLKYQASYDELTGLLNRRSFEAELKQLCEDFEPGSTPSYLLFMDLDQFKVVNDTSGHAAGDQLLRNVGDVLLGIVRTNDVVSRLGGDEFGIILRKCPAAVAKRIAETIRQSIENLRFPWGSEVYRIGISIGGLPIDPDSGDASELQQLADAACYAAKDGGRNRVHMVDGDRDSALVRRGQVRWVQRLREAMDNKRFVLYGQKIKPIAENSTEPERLEVLLRLRDPATRRLIPPGAFLPAAERYGLSVELDQWVVRNLLDMLFVHQTVETEYRKYWVNLSGTSIGDKRFAQFLVAAIESSPLPKGTVNFEITETAVIRNVTEAGRLMTQLRQMGCKFALDDFGSGLSSFGHLKNLPVDYVKIDGMFTRDILKDNTNRIFVKSIIDIAHNLGIRTIAEFVECNETLELLRELNVDYVQGFGIGKPYALAPSFPLSSQFGGPLTPTEKIAS